MPQKRYQAEQIIPKLREAEVLLAKGMTVEQACRQIEISEQTYYRWRKKYGGLNMDQAKQLRELLKENSRLKGVVADQALDIAILKEASRPNF